MWRALRNRWRWVAGVVAALGVAVLVLNVVRSDPPGDLEQLERASQAGERAQQTSTEIVDNLERIAANLEAGKGFSEQSEEIQELTRRQQRSLRDLAGILRSQLDSLRDTQRSLRRTRSAVTGVARLGAKQQALLDRALDALDRIEAFAERASDRSADFAWRALYGARLAEDSRDSFSRP